jgi:hypothetical protein
MSLNQPTPGRVLLIFFGIFALLFNAPAKIMDGGVDPANLGKGEWIYILSQAVNGMNGNVPSITDQTTMMTYLKGRGVQHLIVKAGDGGTDFPNGNPQFTASLVNAAHAAGIKIFGYTRSSGVDVPGEIALAAKVYNLGADGFVLDAESEWESQNLPNNTIAATNLCGGIKAQFPNKFLGHSPYPYITSHSSFPYKQFGFYCDAVMPQDYWNEISAVNCSPSQMVTDMSTQWRNWQNGLTGIWTNAIKPICPAGSAWNATCTVSGADIEAFVTALKNDPNPATKGGYHGVNYWRAELQTSDMWAGVKNGDIGTAPVVLTQPKALTVTNVNPTNVTFTVDAAGGNPLKYQWNFNGIAIPGATNATYALDNVQFTNAGNYSVMITNSLGSTNSANAALTVKAPPRITAQPLSQTVVVSNAATFFVIANGTAPLSYQWKLNGTNVVGATSSSFTRTTALSTDAGNYTVVITNAFGSATSAVAVLSVVSSASAPDITLQPQPTTVIAGTPASLSVTVSGTSPFSYQWRLNGTNIASATTSVYTIAGVAPVHAGNYSVVVTNSAGSDTSVSVPLAVHYSLSLAIVGDGAVTKSLNAASYTPGTVVTLTPTSGFANWSGSASGSASPLSVTMNTNKSITATFNTSPVIIESRALDGTAASSTLYTDVSFANSTLKSSASPLSGSTNQGSRFGFSGVPSFTVKPTLPSASGLYLVEITHGGASSISDDIIVTNAVTGGSLSEELTAAFQRTSAVNVWESVGNLSLNAGVTNPQVKFAYASGTLNSSTGRFYSDAVRFTHLPAPLITTQPASRTNLTGANVTFSVEASQATSYQWKFNGTNLAGGTASSYTRTNAQAAHVGNYSVVVSNGNGSLTSSNATLALIAVPTISSGPQNATVNQGQDAVFTVAASGNGPFTYQWRFIGININGATNSQYIRAAVQPSDVGDYSVVVRNTAGSAVSSSATLTVRTPPVIVTDPVDQTVNPGAPVTFTVSASGTGPLSYQWEFDGNVVSGATNSSYFISNAQSMNAGFYSVVVSNLAGVVQSESALLDVNAPPVITSNPDSQSVETGDTVSFYVSASGTAPLFYQWFFNNVPIASATGTSFTKVNVSTNDTGGYRVAVSNIVTVNTSLTATLSVAPLTTFSVPQILSNKTIRLLFTTKPGRTNIVQGSVDLLQWLPIITNVSSNGVEQVIDPETNLLRRFYRAQQAP